MIVAPPPPSGLTVSPAHIELAARSGTTLVQVRNPTSTAIVVDAAAAAYALSSTGRPRVAAARGGVRLVVRPRTLSLAAGATRLVAVSARWPSSASAGDHPELLVLATRPTAGAVGVRLRVGVPVVVRVPGAVVRRLVVERARLIGRVITVELRNRGNVVERLPAVVVAHGRRIVARLLPGRRQVLPGGRALVRLTSSRRVRGRLVIRLAGQAWPVTRTRRE